MSNKTISINPSLFSVGGSKTRKNREKKEPKAIPVISPNLIKSKLLKRIKEHKKQEIKGIEIDKKKLEKQKSDITPTQNFSDEFSDSMLYLQSLMKQKQSEVSAQKRREEIERGTVKNYNAVYQTPQINIDLPEDLVQPVIIPNPTMEPLTIAPMKQDVPYGILKGGIKPSYREWQKTQRNNIVTNPNSSLVIDGPKYSSENIFREKRLNALKEKLKNSQTKTQTNQIETEMLIKKPTENMHQQPKIIPNLGQNHQPIIPNSEQTKQQQIAGAVIATKHITKKTIKRKYTLGKSKIKKTVSVLIKDRGTRKRILTAQKELKRKNINDIKAYLREHNLIKMGSSAPPDVLRKLYESAMLAGEITNSNADTLLHNFSKEDKEL